MIDNFSNELSYTSLGKPTAYTSIYNPNLLQPISRAATRERLQIVTPLQFYGIDIWNAYEFSWLNAQGKPEISILELRFPHDSEYLVESKSVKLYLNAFCQTRFATISDVQKTIQEDLQAAIKSEVIVAFTLQNNFSQLTVNELTGICLDSLPVAIDNYQYHPDYLQTNDIHVEEKVFTHLFRSNCPVTQQPDWASVWIHYAGKQISHAGLLKYFISFRQAIEFAEQCTERMFMDILMRCKPEKLTVRTYFTRRGGIDINSFRTNFAVLPENQRLYRQ